MTSDKWRFSYADLFTLAFLFPPKYCPCFFSLYWLTVFHCFAYFISYRIPTLVIQYFLNCTIKIVYWQDKSLSINNDIYFRFISQNGFTHLPHQIFMEGNFTELIELWVLYHGLILWNSTSKYWKLIWY